MDRGEKTIPVLGTGFSAIQRDYYRRIRAEGAGTVEEREAIRIESEKLNAVQFVEIGKRGSNLSLLHNVRNATKVGTVAVIPVKGVMRKYSSGYWFRTVGTQEIAQHIKAARQNPMVSAIVMDFDSGGGMVDGNYVFCDEIFKAQDDKPVYGYVNGMAASAAYQAASQCTKLFMAGPTDYVGSIGVFQMHVDESKWLENWGLVVKYIVADGGENKIVAPSTQPLSPEDEAKVKVQLNELRGTMIAQIERGRGNRIKSTEDTYKGGIFTAKQAKRMGLVDGVATLEDVILKAYRAGEKKKKSTGSGAAIIHNPNGMNLKTFIGGLFGNDSTPTFSEDQTLTASEATQFAKQTAETIAAKEKAEGEAAEATAKVTQLETQLEEANTKAEGLETQVQEANTKAKDLQTKFDELSEKVAKLEGGQQGKEGEEGNQPEGKKEGEGEEGEGEEGNQPEGKKEGEADPMKEFAEQLATLATQVETLKAEKQATDKKAKEAEAKYEKLVGSYKKLSEAQGKGGLPEGEEGEEEEGNGNRKRLGNSSKLPSISSYVRQMGIV